MSLQDGVHLTQVHQLALLQVARLCPHRVQHGGRVPLEDGEREGGMEGSGGRERQTENTDGETFIALKELGLVNDC